MKERREDREDAGRTVRLLQELDEGAQDWRRGESQAAVRLEAEREGALCSILVDGFHASDCVGELVGEGALRRTRGRENSP